MADIPGNTSTTATLTVGSAVSGSLETVGDHDWYRISLAPGQSITVTLNWLSSADPNNPYDPFLNIRDASGTVVYTNDDINLGVNLNSQVSFSSATGGTYYIDVGAYADGSAGTYQVSVQPYTPPPLATNDQVADQLVNGYWGGDSHRFNVTQGGTINVSFGTAMTPAELNLARTALRQWSDIIGVNFSEVLSGGQIQFSNAEGASGGIAATDANWRNGIITSADIQISSSWVTRYGTSLYSYSFQTYLHEIGHALGLGHSGNYNETADYPYDALFQNDAWPVSVMSYFDQNENTYFGGQGFTVNYITTPMVADILAMQQLYGLSTTTRTGDTTYGYNTNAGGAYDASAYPRAAYTIFDNGGNDTLDFSGSSANQLINLNPETYSNVNGRTGNLAIARGVVIENATGGSAADTIIGNGADNVLRGGSGADIFTGGGGNDTFLDTSVGHNGDRINDFNAGDKIVFSDAALGSFTFSLSGNTLTYSGGSLTLSNLPNGTLVPSAAAGGGVQLMLQSSQVATGLAVHNDINGDGWSDILWRNDNGQFNIWQSTGNGNFITSYSTAVTVGQAIVGTGDFNGDGREDILWRSANGQLDLAQSQASGGFVTTFTSTIAGPSWQVVGTGDFNGDLRDDIVWRNTNGQLNIWQGTSTGSFITSFTSTIAGPSWRVAGTGDFNGDGRDDIVWRNDNGQLNIWQATNSGNFVTSFTSTIAGIDWHVAGIGDFNGDGLSDIAWRNDSGQFNVWQATANGSFVTSYSSMVANSWQLDGIGDFNGNGTDDLVWRNDSGQINIWQGGSNGTFTQGYFTSSVAGNDWHVQDLFL